MSHTEFHVLLLCLAALKGIGWAAKAYLARRSAAAMRRTVLAGQARLRQEQAARRRLMADAITRARSGRGRGSTGRAVDQQRYP